MFRRAGHAHAAKVIGYRTGVTVLQTVLALVVIPAVIYGVIMLLTLWPKFVRSRPQAGEDWDFEPVLWVSNPAGVSASGPRQDSDQDSRTTAARGGARGNW